MNSDFCVGVHALVYLSHKNCCLSSEELAENICTNRVRVRRVMGRLGKAGLVDTKSGSEGGYTIARKAEDITLAEVADALDTRFVSSGWQSGNLDNECLVSSGMGPMMDSILDELDEGCRARLRQKTIGGLEGQIFHQADS